ncbi:hypothetical protein GH714_034590 [Hevea brasiliensis]|uniref:Uncharacterized protein n=1 Tax=Hevea brasiliensis TaxID=3981 RepID=A0A6A6LVS5_HEVBR|nr:hypothetical protein GH714_034590 [Hevea brasiliensis]
MNIFKKKTSPKDALRVSKREMAVATRGIEREIASLQLEQMAPAKQAKVIKEFQKQSAQMDMTIEMMSESIDETLDKDEAEEETEELTNQVLDEIGVDIASQLSSAPKGRIASRNTSNVVKSAESPDVEDLEKREERMSGFGVVWRLDEGGFVSAFSGIYQGLQSARMVLCLAGYSIIIPPMLETKTDSLEVVQAARFM